MKFDVCLEKKFEMEVALSGDCDVMADLTAKYLVSRNPVAKVALPVLRDNIDFEMKEIQRFEYELNREIDDICRLVAAVETCNHASDTYADGWWAYCHEYSDNFEVEF